MSRPGADAAAGPNGSIAHAEMHLGPGTTVPKSRVPETEFGMKSPRALGGINQCLYVPVEIPTRTMSALRQAVPRSSFSRRTWTMERATTWLGIATEARAASGTVCPRQ